VNDDAKVTVESMYSQKPVLNWSGWRDRHINKIFCCRSQWLLWQPSDGRK